jgi:hypothetical protein
MPYTAEINRGNPTCFVFIIDQSSSMSDAFGTEGSLRKADFVADVVNRTIHDLVIRCTRTEEIRNYYYLSVIGYGGTVGPAFGGSLSGKTLIPISEVAEMPASLEDRIKKVPDGAGGLVETKVRFPVWMDAVSNGGTPMCQGFCVVRDLLDHWLPEHKNGFPPTILHLTDGESTDGDPSQIGHEILAKRTNDGEVLLFNCHVSSRHSLKIEYPSDDSQLPDDFAKMLFNVSSRLPEPFRRAASEIGINMGGEGARGFVFNGDPAAVAQFFDIGTRPANLR